MLKSNINRIARSQGYSILHIEREVGFPRSSIDKWDRNAPSVWKVKAVADFLGVSIEELLKEDTPDDLD